MPAPAHLTQRLVLFLRKNFLSLVGLVVIAGISVPLVYQYVSQYGRIALVSPPVAPDRFVLNTIAQAQDYGAFDSNSGSLNFKTGEWGYSNGGVVVLSASETPELTLVSSGGASGEGAFRIYPVSKEDLFHYLTYRTPPESAGGRGSSIERLYRIDPTQLAEPTNVGVMIQPTVNDQSQETILTLPISDTGIWFLEGGAGGATVQTMIVRSHLAGIAHEGNNESIFWVQDSNYQSVPDAQLELVRLEGGRQVFGTATTNADGLAVAAVNDRIDLALITRGDDFTIVPLNLENLSQFSWFDRFARREAETESFLFTDRFLYKPGDTVFFKAIIREDDDAQYTIAPRTVRVTLGDSESPLWQADMGIDHLGTIDGAIPLPGDLEADYYSLSIREGEKHLAYQSLQVARYRKPDATIRVDTDKLAYLPGETITAHIVGEYFLGQPSAHQEVRWQVFQKQADVSGSYETVSFGERTEYYGGDEENLIDEGVVVLDQNGQAELKLPTINNTGRRQFWQIQLELLDADSSAANDEMRVLVNPGDFVIEKDWEKGVSDPIVRQSVRYPFKLYPNKPGAEVSGVRVQGTLSLREDYQGEYVVERDNITTESDSKGEFSLEFTPQRERVYYKLELATTDRSGQPITQEITWYSSDTSTQTKARPTPVIKIATDKSEYKPGETAQVTITLDPAIKNSFVSLGRSYSRDYRVVPVTNGTAVFETVIPEAYQPNFFVYAGSFFEGAWERAMTEVIVDTADKKLTIDIDFSQQEYGPAETAQVEIAVTDGLGNPVQTDLAFWLFDKALLELHGVYFDGIFGDFWQHRWFGIKTNNSFQGIISHGVEGGGGGGGESRSVFKDTAYWNPHVMTGPDGRATLSVELPDNLTTWVAAAVAASTRTQVGDAFTEITVSKDVVVRPILPNFLRTGDQFILAALLHNFTQNTEEFSVTASFAEGETRQAQQQATALPGKPVGFTWPLTIPSSPEANFMVRAEGIHNTDLVDQVSQAIPVYGRGFWQHYTQPLFEGDLQFSVELEEESDAASATGQLVLRPFRYPQLQVMLDRMLQNYWSDFSSADVLIAASLFRQYGTQANLQYSPERINEVVDESLQILARNQNSDGTWGSSSVFQSDLNTFILEALARAEQAGFSVDPMMLDRSLGFFRDWQPQLLYDQIAQQYVFSLFPEREFARRQIPLIETQSLRDTTFAQALLANNRQGFVNPPEALDRFVNVLPYNTATQLSWQDARDNERRFSDISRPTALAVRALLTTDTELPKIEKALDYLHRNPSSRFEETSGWLAIATLEYMEKANQFSPNYSYTVLMDDQVFRQGSITPNTPLTGRIEIALPEPLPETFRLELQHTGSGALYSTFKTSEFFPDFTQLTSPDRNHLTLTRQYLSPKKVQSPLQPGDLVIVQFDVLGLGRGETQVEIEDFLPAGLVPIDESLIGGHFDESGINSGCVRREITEQGMILRFCSMENPVTFSYKARVVSQGVFSVPPATVRLTQDPSIWAQTAAETLSIDGEYALDLLGTKTPETRSDIHPLFFALPGAVALFILGGVLVRIRREKALERLQGMQETPVQNQLPLEQPAPEPESESASQYEEE